MAHDWATTADSARQLPDPQVPHRARLTQHYRTWPSLGKQRLDDASTASA